VPDTYSSNYLNGVAAGSTGILELTGEMYLIGDPVSISVEAVPSRRRSRSSLWVRWRSSGEGGPASSLTMLYVSEKTIGRLSLYRRLLEGQLAAGASHAYSHQLANLAGVTAAQVRRDLMAVGYSGCPSKDTRFARCHGALGRFWTPRLARESPWWALEIWGGPSCRTSRGGGRT